MNINNRRYTGSKYKLLSWIRELLQEHCKDCSSFFDVNPNYIIDDEGLPVCTASGGMADIICNEDLFIKGFDINEFINILKEYDTMDAMIMES